MQFATKILEVSWLGKLDKESLNKVLLEYELISRNFVPWLLFIMANAKDERVRQLLLPNLTEESGTFKKNNSHHILYLKMVKSFGLKVENFQHSPFTVKAEREFRSIFKGKNTYKSLCILGPAIEEISSDFLAPMYWGVKRNYGDESRHMIYFPLHLSEMEDEHAGCINDAIALMEEKNPRLKKSKSKHVNEGIAIFETFWNDVKTAVEK